ncbi:uncharacterized protein LOC134248002 [Saccostrea cucullata]|uniref:uncharacterized protein LOC134248002 n=1 Tax=Saccostrea cuccullata TaxID=36930 RepID=UPI002ED29870
MKTSNFYGLPKIHKSSDIKTAIEKQNGTYIATQEPTDLKLRPIVAGPACPTHRLSNFIDILLKDLCVKVPSYIRDSMDFLNKIPENVEPDTLLVTFDVKSLYTNIPHDLGLEAIKFWIEKYPELIPRNISSEFILDSVRFILENNTFHFDGDFYKQIKGTAMGTKMAPTYSILVMGFFEETLYQKVSDELGQEIGKHLRDYWKQFLDDCFLFWNKSEEDLQTLYTLLNSINPNLQFTMEHSDSSIPFLDVMIALVELTGEYAFILEANGFMSAGKTIGPNKVLSGT